MLITQRVCTSELMRMAVDAASGIQPLLARFFSLSALVGGLVQGWSIYPSITGEL